MRRRNPAFHLPLLRAGAVVAVVVFTLAGCLSDLSVGASADPPPPVPHGDPVSFYVQNLTDAPVEFTMLPIADPPALFEILPGKLGAGCMRVPADWQLAQTEAGKPPGQAAVLRIVARDAQGGTAQSVWVSVTAAALTTGNGVPVWWAHEAQACAPQR